MPRKAFDDQRPSAQDPKPTNLPMDLQTTNNTKIDTRDDSLVSVLVATFNSADYLEETLESVYSQTYPNIELIISDDGSTDNTISLARKWLERRGSRFTNTKILEVEKNTGIPSNLNRGIRASHGAWIKPLAGDDLLLPTCIEDNINFCRETQAEAVFSIRLSFRDTSQGRKVVDRSKTSIFCDPAISAEQQHWLTLWQVGCPPNTLFYSRNLLDQVGGFDEAFPLIEDWPMNIRVTLAGFRLAWMERETFLYRLRDDSVFHNDQKKLIIPKWGLQSAFPVFKKYVFPNINAIDRLAIQLRHWIQTRIYQSNLNKRTVPNRLVVKLLLWPAECYIAMRKSSVVATIGREIRKRRAQDLV